ncbi:MAG TPA: hypothetical protein VLI39_19240 [Sedimentisphaerales bacterium]|nr:hypothetical protein [Sedimentisphaerales bacterium]
MGESERASGRDEGHIPLFCEKSLAVHLAGAVIADIGAVCAKHAVGMLSITQTVGALDERVRVLRELRPDRMVGRLLERVEGRLVADVLDSVHASRAACESAGSAAFSCAGAPAGCDAPSGQERRERRKRRENFGFGFSPGASETRNRNSRN